jgi:ribosomal protein S18 acetylase RimI-like enzyme
LTGLDARPFERPDDLEAMKSIARLARASAPRAGHWHPGELDWWFFYGPDKRPSTTLWFDAEGPAGWVVVNEDHRVADSAVRPELTGGPLEGAITRHVESRLGPGAITLFATSSADDAPRRTLLAAHGYERTTAYLQAFVASCGDLSGSEVADGPGLPAGFRLLDSLTDDWVAERAECHRRAFDPSLMTPERYTAFRLSPGYDPTLDVAVVTDDDRVAAYVMAWADPVSRCGQLEPVGTRPHFWRRGLGRAACGEAVRRLAERGMELVGVNADAADARSVAFYQSCGFRPVATIDRWVRSG